MELPPPAFWKLRRKNATPVLIEEVKRLPTARVESKDFFARALWYFDLQHFENLHTSRTIKPMPVSYEDAKRAVGMQKFELCHSRAFQGASLPLRANGGRAFALPGLKGRGRLITEPHRNAAIAKHAPQRLKKPSRFEP